MKTWVKIIIEINVEIIVIRIDIGDIKRGSASAVAFLASFHQGNLRCIVFRIIRMNKFLIFLVINDRFAFVALSFFHSFWQ